MTWNAGMVFPFLDFRTPLLQSAEMPRKSKMKQSIRLCFGRAFVLLAFAVSANGAGMPVKKLIEFGWDEPDPRSCAGTSPSWSSRLLTAAFFTLITPGRVGGAAVLPGRVGEPTPLPRPI